MGTPTISPVTKRFGSTYWDLARPLLVSDQRPYRLVVMTRSATDRLPNESDDHGNGPRVGCGPERSARASKYDGR